MIVQQTHPKKEDSNRVKVIVSPVGRQGRPGTPGISIRFFDTLQEALDLQPRPENGVTFQVREGSDPENFGFYVFDDREPEGYRYLGERWDDEYLTQIEDRIDTFEQEVDGRVEGLETRVEGVEQDVAGFKDEVEDRVEGVETDVSEFKTEVNQRVEDAEDAVQSLQDTTARYAFDTLQEAQDKWASFSQEEKDELDGKEFTISDKVHKWTSTGPSEPIRDIYLAEGKVQAGDKKAVSGGEVYDHVKVKADHGYASIEGAKTLKQVEDNTSVKVTNLIVNGDFANGVTGWDKPLTSTAVISVVNKELIVTGGTGTGKRVFQTISQPIGNGDVCYVKADVLVESLVDGDIRLLWNGTDNSDSAYLGVILREEIPPYVYTTLKGRFTRNFEDNNTGNVRIQIQALSGENVPALKIKNVLSFNLTAIFGEGNEPTNEEFELLLAILGIDYFEGEISIPAQKIMQWQLKSISQLESTHRNYRLGYIHKESGIKIESSNYAVSNYYKITDKNNLVVTGFSGVSNNVALVAFYDKEFNFLGSYNSSTHGEVSNVLIPVESIPEGAYYVRCTFASSQVPTALEDLKGLEKEQLNWVDLETILNQKAPNIFGDSKSSLFNEVGYINKNSGELDTSSLDYRGSLFLLITDKNNLVVTGFSGVSNNVALVAFYDNKLSFLGYHNAPTHGNVSDYSIPAEEIPDNAKYIRFTRYQSQEVSFYGVSTKYDTSDVLKYIEDVKELIPVGTNLKSKRSGKPNPDKGGYLKFLNYLGNNQNIHPKVLYFDAGCPCIYLQDTLSLGPLCST